MPMPERFEGYLERPARVSSICLVSVARNCCSVPCELVEQMVSEGSARAESWATPDDAAVARHERLSDSGGTRYEWQYYIPLGQCAPGVLHSGAPFAGIPEALHRVRRGLLRQAGSNREMAQVLAIVATEVLHIFYQSSTRLLSAGRYPSCRDASRADSMRCCCALLGNSTNSKLVLSTLNAH